MTLSLMELRLTYRKKSMGISLPVANYFSQNHLPFRYLCYRFVRELSLHPGLSTTQDDFDWFNEIYQQPRVFSPLFQNDSGYSQTFLQYRHSTKSMQIWLCKIKWNKTLSLNINHKIIIPFHFKEEICCQCTKSI